MKYFELKCEAYLKKDIIFQESFDAISKYISFSLMRSPLNNFHTRDGFKHYTFGSFYPLEKSKIYKSGNIYKFTLRSLNEEFINYVSIALRENINNPNFLVLKTTKTVIKQYLISELYSATPVIVTLDRGVYWSVDKSGDILLLQKQLHDNLEKKYKIFFAINLETNHNFIQLLEIKNQKPQSIYFTKDKKSVRLFGNKFKIIPNDDEISQKLAFTALACGLGEKNSFGGGFCLGKGVSGVR